MAGSAGDPSNREEPIKCRAVTPLSTDPLYGDDYFNYLRHRGVLRRFIRRSYLRDIAAYCQGRTIDFGCGIGELLGLLPEGSVGFEINPVVVAHCRQNGLEVFHYDPVSDEYRLEVLMPGTFDSFTMNHVLEHLADPADVLSRIFDSCTRLGIRRIVLTVPGRKGYSFDQTHLTFVDETYLRERGLLDHPAFVLRLHKHYPVNWRSFGAWFTHNEYRLVFDARHA
jgi:SAM-dependent methyltransferase